MTPIAYALTLSDAQRMRRELRSSGVVVKVRRLEYGIHHYALEVNMSVATVAADLACVFARVWER